MALFESYERRIDKINVVVKEYGFNSLEETKDYCLEHGVDVDRVSFSDEAILSIIRNYTTLNF